ncbi:MAG TPA: FAD/NAD(P)-binding oxidoreductase [Chloroflexota bacterium]|nr:FAD/NAD(P)-binding oxidoreductase [Chloroflexota bacterium]
MAKTVLVLGGGIGGVVAARELRKGLGSSDRVILIDRDGKHLFSPSLLWVMEGTRKLDAIVRNLERLRRKGIEVIVGAVTDIDTDNRRVTTDAGEFDYDALVISLGAELAPDLLPGFAEAALTPYDLEGAERTRDAVAGFDSGKIVVMISSLPYKCPAAPYETTMFIDHALRKRGVRGGVEIEFITPEPQPMPVAGPELGRIVEMALAARRITYRSGLTPDSIDVDGKAVVLAGGERVGFDLLVGIPPHRTPGVIRESGLANEAGWIPVNHNTLTTPVPGVFAIGDVTAIMTPSGMPLPKAGVFAEGQAKTAAAGVAGYFSGKDRPTANFYGHGECFLETGGGVAGRATGNFYAEPKPRVKFNMPGRFWHWQKWVFEKWWMFRWAP